MDNNIEIWKLAIGSAGLIGIFVMVLTISFKLGKFAKSFEIIQTNFETIEKKFDKIDARFDKIEIRFEKIDHRFDCMENKIDNISERVARIEGAMWRSGTGVV